MLLLSLLIETQGPEIYALTGVYQGKTLFIQNTYDPQEGTFCISQIYLNDQLLNINYKISALKIDFKGIDMYSPVVVKIIHDPVCKPIVVNPDAVFFHSVFQFESINISDTSLTWATHGESENSNYILQQYANGIWISIDTIEAAGDFGGASYVLKPFLEEGPNKLRIQYSRADDSYLLSREIDFHYYPEPVEFKPFVADRVLNLSRTAQYDIYDAGGKLMTSGQGSSIDVSELPSGDYVIYFDKKEPGVFKKR